MGVAEVIPGISGGTLALILGVYERLINAIHGFNFSLFHLVRKRKLKEAWQQIDGTFILILFVGMLVSIFMLSSLILFFMDEFPIVFKSFLSAILLCSAFLEPLKPKISKSFLIGLFISLIVCSTLYLLPSIEIIEIKSWYVFFSGFIAITALVVPGISGSFILLLLGSYTTMLQAVRNLDFLIISIFLLGAVIGLLSIVRVIKLLYERQKDLLLAIFFGLIIFCIPLIWISSTSAINSSIAVLPILAGISFGVFLVFLIQKLRRN